MKNREAMVLNSRIEKILERVYSINESISVHERKELKRGFEEGINEFFGGLGKLAAKAQKFVSGMGQKAKQAYDDMVSKGKSFYEKGKQLAGQAWEAMQKFASDVVAGVKKALGDAAEYVVSNYNGFKDKIALAYQESMKAIQDAYVKMKEKGEAFAEACKGVWTDILEETALLIQSCKEKMVATKEGISEWIAKNKQELEKNAAVAKSSAIESMRELSEMTSTALQKGKQVVGDVAAISLFICVFPILKLVEGVRAIPGLYESAVSISKEFIQKEIQSIRESYQKEMAKESFKYLKSFESFKY